MNKTTKSPGMKINSNVRAGGVITSLVQHPILTTQAGLKGAWNGVKKAWEIIW